MILRESVQDFETIGLCKDILKNIQKILMLHHRIKLALINLNEKNEVGRVPDYIVLFSVLILSNCRNLLEQIFLIGDYLEIKENVQGEKMILNNIKVLFIFILLIKIGVSYQACIEL